MMACPTCDHTMAGIGNLIWHCPRCGTVKKERRVEGQEPKVDVYVPALAKKTYCVICQRELDSKAEDGSCWGCLMDAKYEEY